MKLKDKIQAFVDQQYKFPKGWIGTYFGEKMVWQHKPETLWAIELLDLQQGNRILELGCGSGYAMKLILEHDSVNKVVGLDISPAVIRSAAIRNRKALQNNRAELVQGDVSFLPFEETQFDKIVSIHSIYFWEELATTISEIHRVLNPGGTCVITLCNGKGEESWTGINQLIDEQVVPLIEKTGFIETRVIKGPNSRQFHTVAVCAKKNFEIG